MEGMVEDFKKRWVLLWGSWGRGWGRMGWRVEGPALFQLATRWAGFTLHLRLSRSQSLK